MDRSKQLFRKGVALFVSLAMVLAYTPISPLPEQAWADDELGADYTVITASNTGGTQYSAAVKSQVTYTGSEIKPTDSSVDLKVWRGGKEDYSKGEFISRAPDDSATGESDSVTYRIGDAPNHDYKNAGNVSFIVTVDGAVIFTGYQIAVCSITDNDKVDVKLSEQSLVYNGTDQTPDPTVTINGVSLDKYDVSAGKGDYTVSYSDNKNVGTATVTVSGSGSNIYGQKSTTFEITKAPLSGDMITLDPSADKTYDGNSHNLPTPTVSFTSATGAATGVTETLTTTSSQLSEAKWTKTGGAEVSSSVTDADTYTYTIKAAEIGNFSGEVSKSWKVNAKALADDMIKNFAADKTYVYNTAQKPEYKIEDTSPAKITDADHTDTWTYTDTDSKTESITYADDSFKNAGTYTLTVEGQNNYTGKLTKTYKIEQRAISESGITVGVKSQTGTGLELKPEVTVKDGDSTLVSGTDYEVTYTASETAVLADKDVTLTITGLKNYTGSRSETFHITKPGAVLKTTTNEVTSAVGYTNFSAAYEAITTSATDGTTYTILLNEDVTGSLTFNGGKTLTLDLGGKTVTNSSGVAITVGGSENLTITGSGTVQGGSSGVCLTNSAKTTISGGTFTGDGSLLANTGGTLTIEGGTFTANNGSANLFSDSPAANVSISGGTFTAKLPAGVDNSVLKGKITGGTFSEAVNKGFLPTGNEYSVEKSGNTWVVQKATPVAEFDNIVYTKFEDAIDAANGGVIKLAETAGSAAIAQTLSVTTGSVLLDLNGKTLAGKDNAAISVVADATLAVIDTKGNGSITGSVTNSGTLNIGRETASDGDKGAKITGTVTNNKTLNAYKGTFENTTVNNSEGATFAVAGTTASVDSSDVTFEKSGSGTITAIDNKGALAVKAGLFKGLDVAVNNSGTISEFAGAQVSSCVIGIKNLIDGKATIGAATFASCNQGFENAAGAELTISDGTVTTSGIAVVNYGTAKITGGKISSTGSEALSNAGDSASFEISSTTTKDADGKVTAYGTEVNARDASTNLFAETKGAAGSIQLEGGKFTGKLSGNSDATKPVTITGGNFSERPKSVYVATGYVADKDGETFTVAKGTQLALSTDGYMYSTLKEAVEEAGATAQTITLQANSEAGATVMANQNITIDLAGCKIAKGSGADAAVAIENNGTLKIIDTGKDNEQGSIKDAAVTNNGTLDLSDAGTNAGDLGVVLDGSPVTNESAHTLSVNKGTVKNVSGTNTAGITNKGTLNVKDGVAFEACGTGIDNQSGASATIGTATFTDCTTGVQNAATKSGDEYQFTVNGATFTISTSSAAGGSVAIDNSGDAKVTNATVNKSYETAINNNTGDIRVEGGSYTTTGTTLTNSGTATIAAGTFISDVSVLGNTAGTLTIEPANDSDAKFTANSGSGNLFANTVSGSVKINGGTFDGKLSGNTPSNKLIEIGKGSFKNRPESIYIATGKLATKDNTGRWQVGQGDQVALSSDGFMYGSVQDAVDAAPKGTTETTITLQCDTTENVTIPAGKNIKLDLQSFTLTQKTGELIKTDYKKKAGGTDTWSFNSAILVVGKLTITGKHTDATTDTEAADGTVSANGSNAIAVFGQDGQKANGESSPATGDGTLVIGGATKVVNGKDGGYGVLAMGGASATIQDTASVEAYYSAFAGNNTYGAMNFYINGGTLTAKNGPAVYMPGPVGLTMAGGTLNGGISARMGTIKITGGTINGGRGTTEPLAEKMSNGKYNFEQSGNILLNDAIFVFAGTYNAPSNHDSKVDIDISGDVTINAGTNGRAIAFYDIGNKTQAQSVKIGANPDDSTKTPTINGKAGGGTQDAYAVVTLKDLDIPAGYVEGLSGYNYEGKTDAAKVETKISAGTFDTKIADEYMAANAGLEVKWKSDGSAIEGYSIKSNAFAENFGVTHKGVEYVVESLKDALGIAENGDTIAVKQSVSASDAGTVPADKALTLDLTGNNLTFDNSAGLTNDGTLTLTDTGKSAGTQEDPKTYGTLTCATGITNNNKLVVDMDGGTLSGAQITNTANAKTTLAAGASLNANIDKGLVVKSGIFEMTSGTAIKNSGSVFVEGGTFKCSALANETADAQARFEQASGSTLKVETAKDLFSNADNATLEIASGTYTATDASDKTLFASGGLKGTITLSGGTFTGTMPGNATDALTVTGGIYSDQNVRNNLETRSEGDELAIRPEDEKYKVVNLADMEASVDDVAYETFADAVAAAEKSANTTKKVVLVKSEKVTKDGATTVKPGTVVVKAEVNISANVEIDLQGRTFELAQDGNKADHGALVYKNGLPTDVTVDKDTAFDTVAASDRAVITDTGYGTGSNKSKGSVAITTNDASKLGETFTAIVVGDDSTAGTLLINDVAITTDRPNALLAENGLVKSTDSTFTALTSIGALAKGIFSSKTIIAVGGGSQKASLTMPDGTISVKDASDGSDLAAANLRYNDKPLDDGTYGIFASQNSFVTLGVDGSGSGSDNTGPTIKTNCAAVGANNTKQPVSITIYRGTYTSTVNDTAAGHERWNCAVYMPAEGTLDIRGGTFTGYTHAVSIPYQMPAVELNISGGEFGYTSTEGNGADLYFGANKGSMGGGIDKTDSFTIKGGTFKGTVLSVEKGAIKDAETGIIENSTNVKLGDADSVLDYFKDGYGPTAEKDTDGYYTVSKSIADTFTGSDSAWTDGSLVTKLAYNNAASNVPNLGLWWYGYNITAESTGSKSNPTKLTKDTDYTVTYYAYNADSTAQTEDAKYEECKNGVTDVKDVNKYRMVLNGKGGYVGTLTIDFEIAKVNLSESATIEIADGDKQVYTGAALTPRITVTARVNNTSVTLSDGSAEGSATDYEAIYTNNVNAGTADIVIIGRGNYEGAKNTNFEIAKRDLSKDYSATDFAGASVMTDIPSSSEYTYTGTAIEPAVTVSAANTPFEADKDYEISYAGDDVTSGKALNANAEGKSYTLKVSPKDTKNFEGEREFQFTIKPKDLSSATVTVDGSYAYTGSAITPDVTVKDGEKAITGYEVSYEKKDVDGNFATCNAADVKDAGDYKAVVKPGSNSNYQGKNSQTFTIAPRDISDAVVSTASKTYNQQDQTPAASDVTVSSSFDVNGTETVLPLASATDYSVEFYKNYDESTKAFSDKVSALTDAGTYHVKVAGAGNFAGTAHGTYTIAPLDISSSAAAAKVTTNSVAYRGKKSDGTKLPVSPDPKLALKLTSGATDTYTLANTTGTDAKTEYSVTYEDSTGATVSATDLTEVGTYMVTVKGEGNFTGTKTGTFEVAPANIDTGVTFASIADAVYTGQAIKPVVDTVTYDNGTPNDTSDDVVLTKDTDCTLDYVNNTDASTGGNKAKVVITGKGGYTGSAAAEFAITPKGLTASDVTVTGDTVSYTGKAQEPTIVVKDGEKELAAGTDYTVSYTAPAGVELVDGKPVAAGNYTVTVTGTGNYKDAVTKSFTINKVNVTAPTATDTIYTSEEQEGVRGGEHYTLSVDGDGARIDDNGNVVATKAGTYTVTATLDDIKNYVWADDSSNTAKTIEWTIKAADQGTNVASITTTDGGALYYATVQEAVSNVSKAADGQTVKLVADATGTLKLASGNIRFDLGGKKLTVNTKEGITVSTGATLEITNGTITGSADDIINANGGTVTLGSGLTITCTSSVVWAHNKGTVVIDGANVSGAAYATAFAKGENSSIELKSGSVKSTDTNALCAKDKAIVTVSGGEASTETYPGGYTASGGEIKVVGGTVKSEKGYGLIAASQGKIEVSGGAVEGACGVLAHESDLSSVRITGGTIKAKADNYYAVESKRGNITISGDVNIQGLATAGGEGGTLEISGGTFSTSVDDKYVVEGFGVPLGGGTVTKSVKNASVDWDGVTNSTFTYGSTAMFEPTVVYKSYTDAADAAGATLTKGTDYTVTCKSVGVGGVETPVADLSQLLGAGSYKLYISGANGYVGSTSVEFTVAPLAFTATDGEGKTGVALAAGENPTFTGEGLTPALNVTTTVNGKQVALVLGTDYTVSSYTGNTNAGTDTAKATVEGRGNYDGTVELNFTIAPKSIAGVTVSGIRDLTYNGKDQMPENVKVTDGDRSSQEGQGALSMSADYGIKYQYKSGENTWTDVSAIKNAGSYKAVITGKGNYVSSKEVTFEVVKDAVALPVVTDTTYSGSSQTGVAGNKELYKLEVTGDNATDATVSTEDGSVSATKAGTYTVKATLVDSDNNKWKDGTTDPVELTWTINKADLGSCKVEALDAKTYNGSEQTPDATTLKLNSNELSAGEFATTYAPKDGDASAKLGGGGKPLNAGTYIATFTAAENGNFTGTATGEFAIAKADISGVSVEQLTPLTYTGEAQELAAGDPKITLGTGEGAYQLVAGDYAVSYAVAAGAKGELKDGKPVNAGTYTVTFTGAGDNFDGTKTNTAELTVNKQTVEVPAAVTGLVYNGEEQTGVVAPEGAPYKLEGNAATNAENYAAKATLTDADNYEWKTATSADGTDAVRTIDWTIAKHSVSGAFGAQYVTVAPLASQTYTGAAIEPTLTVTGMKGGSEKLAAGTDFTVTYSQAEGATGLSGDGKPLGAGDYTVKLTFNKNYEGDVTVPFTITKKSLADSDVEVAVAGTTTYTGGAQTPTVTVTSGTGDDAITYTENTDYTVSYLLDGKPVDTVKAIGEYTVVVTGKDSCEGENKTVTFEIKNADQKDAVASITTDGTLYYDTVQAAVDAATAGQTVKLVADAKAQTVNVAEGKEIVLDLNGFRLSSKDAAGEGPLDTISNHGKLTVTDTAREGATTGTVEAAGYAALVNYPGATATVSGGKLTTGPLTVGNKTQQWYTVKNLGTLNFESAEGSSEPQVTTTNRLARDNGPSLIDNGWYGNAGNDRGLSAKSYTNPTATLNVSAGTFTGGINAVKNDDYGVFNATGGTFETSYGPALLNWNVTEISGGTFTSKLKESESPMVIANGSYGANTEDKGSLTITGGTFKSVVLDENGDETTTLGNLFNDGLGSVAKDGKVSISGGTFEGTVARTAKSDFTVSGESAWSDDSFDKYAVEGMGAKKDVDGKWVVDKSVKDVAVSVDKQTYTYVTEITPVVTYKSASVTETTLTADTDYTLSYAKDGEALTEAPATFVPGTYTLTVTGAGEYVGTKTATFEVVLPEGMSAVFTALAGLSTKTDENDWIAAINAVQANKTADVDKVAAANTAYANLDEAAKTAFDAAYPGLSDALDAAVKNTSADAQAAQALVEKIAELPVPNEVTEDTYKTAADLLAEYSNMNGVQKAIVDAAVLEDKTLGEDAEVTAKAWLDAVKTAADALAANTVAEQVATALADEDATLDQLQEARAAYNAATEGDDEAKGKIDATIRTALEEDENYIVVDEINTKIANLIRDGEAAALAEVLTKDNPTVEELQKAAEEYNALDEDMRDLVNTIVAGNLNENQIAKLGTGNANVQSALSAREQSVAEKDAAAKALKAEFDEIPGVKTADAATAEKLAGFQTAFNDLAKEYVGDTWNTATEEALKDAVGYWRLEAAQATFNELADELASAKSAAEAELKAAKAALANLVEVETAAEGANIDANSKWVLAGSSELAAYKNARAELEDMLAIDAEEDEHDQKETVTAAKIEGAVKDMKAALSALQATLHTGSKTTAGGDYTADNDGTASTYQVVTAATTATSIGTVNYKSAAATTAGSFTIPTTVKIGDRTYKVTGIANEAFRNSKVTSVVVGDNITSISSNAFKNAKTVTTVTIGKGVKKVGKKAFKNAKKVKTVIVKTKLLKTKKAVKAFLKSSKVKTVKISLPSKDKKKVKKAIKKWGGKKKGLKIK